MFQGHIDTGQTHWKCFKDRLTQIKTILVKIPCQYIVAYTYIDIAFQRLKVSCRDEYKCIRYSFVTVWRCFSSLYTGLVKVDKGVVIWTGDVVHNSVPL